MFEKIDAKFLGRFLTDEERAAPNVQSYIESFARCLTSGYFYYKLLKATMIHEAAHAVFAENFGCKRIELTLPYVKIQRGNPRGVNGSVSFVRPHNLSPEHCLKIWLAGPIVEERLCPDCYTASERYASCENDMDGGKEEYLELGGLESNFKEDSTRIVVEIIEELNDKWLRERIYDTAEKFRRLFPPCELRDECYHHPIYSPETQEKISRLTELFMETKDARLLLAS